MRLTIPISPSVNHLYRPTRNGGRCLTDEARAYRDYVGLLTRHAAIQANWDVLNTDRYGFEIGVWWPDHRRRDIDNLMKLTIDSICPALGFDDSRIVRILLEARGVDRDNPRCDVRVEVL